MRKKSFCYSFSILCWLSVFLLGSVKVHAFEMVPSSKNEIRMTTEKGSLALSKKEYEAVWLSQGQLRVQAAADLANKLNQQAQRVIFTVESIQKFTEMTEKKNSEFLYAFYDLQLMIPAYLSLEKNIANIPTANKKLLQLKKQAEIERSKGRYEPLKKVLLQIAAAAQKEKTRSSEQQNKRRDLIAHIKLSLALLSLLELDARQATNWMHEAIDMKSEQEDAALIASVFEMIDFLIQKEPINNLAQELLTRTTQICLEQSNRHTDDKDWLECSWKSQYLNAQQNKELYTELALEQFLQSIEIAQDLIRVQSEAISALAHLMESHHGLSDFYMQIDQLDDALLHASKSLEISNTIASKENPSALTQYSQAKALARVAGVLIRKKSDELALSHLLKSQQMIEKLLQEDQENPLFIYEMSLRHAQLADFYRQKKQLDEALLQYEISIPLLKKLLVQNDQHSVFLSELAFQYGQVAEIQVLKSDKKKAVLYYSTAISIAEFLEDSYGPLIKMKADLTEMRLGLSYLLLTKGKLNENLVQYFSEAVWNRQLIQNSLKPENQQAQLAQSHLNAADMLYNLKQADPAILHLQACLALLQPLIKENQAIKAWQSDQFKCKYTLALSYAQKNEKAKSYQYYLEAAQDLESSLAKNPRDYTFQLHLYTILMTLGVWSGPESTLEKRQSYLQAAEKLVKSMPKSFTQEQYLRVIKIASEISK